MSEEGMLTNILIIMFGTLAVAIIGADSLDRLLVVFGGVALVAMGFFWFGARTEGVKGSGDVE